MVATGQGNRISLGTACPDPRCDGGFARRAGTGEQVDSSRPPGRNANWERVLSSVLVSPRRPEHHRSRRRGATVEVNAPFTRTADMSTGGSPSTPPTHRRGP